MTMTIGEALKHLAGIAVFAPDREALAVIRSRLEVSDEMAEVALKAWRQAGLDDAAGGYKRTNGKAKRWMKAALVAALGE